MPPEAISATRSGRHGDASGCWWPVNHPASPTCSLRGFAADVSRRPKALSLAYGIESYVVLRDIWGASYREVEAVATTFVAGDRPLPQSLSASGAPSERSRVLQPRSGARPTSLGNTHAPMTPEETVAPLQDVRKADRLSGPQASRPAPRRRGRGARVIDAAVDVALHVPEQSGSERNVADGARSKAWAAKGRARTAGRGWTRDHPRASHLCILGEDGQLREPRIRTTPERFAAVLGDRPRARTSSRPRPRARGGDRPRGLRGGLRANRSAIGIAAPVARQSPSSGLHTRQCTLALSSVPCRKYLLLYA